MKRLGKILHLSRSRSLIVKLESNETVKIGTGVYDSKLRKVGVVHDFFGPVSSPFVAVKPDVDGPSRLSGSVLYTLTN